MKTMKSAMQGLIISIFLMTGIWVNAQDAIITVDYSKAKTDYYRPGTDHNIVHGVMTDFQKSVYRQNSLGVIRNFLTVKDFYADETKNVMKTKAELDQRLLNNFNNYLRINDVAKSLLFTIKVTPAWMGQDATFNYSGLEIAMKGILTYLKQTFSKFEYLECWNEPDLFIDTEPGLPNGAETPANYTLIYECYEKAVKYVNATVNNGPKLKIGGPVTSSYKADWVNTLLKFVKEKNLQCDFIAWHSYQNFGGNPGKEVGYCKTSMNSIGVQAKTIISEFGNFAGGHGADGSASDKAKQAATVMDQSYGFVMAGGDVLMTWVAEHIANELKSIFPYDAAVSNQQVGWQTYDFPDVSAKYFFLQFHTTSSLVPSIIKDIQILDENDKIITLAKVRGSSYLIDNNESTVWTSTSNGNYTGTGEHIYSSATVCKISKIKVCWGGTGKYRFDLFHSSNSTNWFHTLGKDYVNPVGHLLFMESKLGNKMIASTSSNVSVNALSTISDTSLAMIVYSRSDVSSFNTSVKISNIPVAFLNKKLIVRRYLTDETHSNFSYNKNKAALEQVCDSIVTTTGSITLNFRQVKNSVSLIEIVPAVINYTTYNLTVISGSGTGIYPSGKTVTLVADAPVIGKMFDKWTGATTGIANVNSASTSYTMPAANTTITATYKDAPKYTLTVANGTGGGSYFPGEQVTITANAAPAGKEFDAWTGTVSSISDINSPSVKFTMPSGNAGVTATYKDKVIFKYTLTVTNGTGSGTYASGEKVSIRANVPAGKKFYRWIGATTVLNQTETETAIVTIPSSNIVLSAVFVDAAMGGETAETEVACFPSPATADLHLANCSAYDLLKVYNVFGTICQSINIEQKNDIQLSVESLSPGMYFIELIKATGESKIVRFQKN